MEEKQESVTEGTAVEAGASDEAATDEVAAAAPAADKPARKPRKPKEPKEPAADAPSDDAAPAQGKHKTLVAKGRIVHGRGTEQLVFEAGKEVTGLSEQEVAYFLEQGLATEV